MTTYYKSPTEKHDYTISYVSDLGADTISSSSWSVPTGITQATPSPSNTTTTTTIWLSGGSEDDTYEIENTVTSVSGEIYHRSIFIYIISPQLGEYISRLRRMIDEDTQTPYSDSLLLRYIQKYAIRDKFGVEPTYIQQFNSSAPPTFVANDYWTHTYDLNAAAADIWTEKASTKVNKFDFRADSAEYKRSQMYEQARKQARFYFSRRAIGAVDLTPFYNYPTSEEATASIND